MAGKGVISAPYQVRGRLSQARNDKLHKTYILMHKLIFLFIFLGIILIAQGIVYPFDFDISPVRIFIDPKAKSATLTLKNKGKDYLTLQLKIYKWTQNADGEDIYEETSDMIIFPKILKIKGEEERLIRIGTKIRDSELEKTYRIYIDELATSPKAPEKGATAQVAMKVGVPVFIRSLKTDVRGKIESFAVRNGKIEVRIKNEGNSHFMIQTTVIKGRNLEDKEVFSRELGGWYLLRGISRIYTIPVPEEICKNLARLDIEVKTDRFNLSGKLDVNQAMCMP